MKTEFWSFQDQLGNVFVFDGTHIGRSVGLKKIEFIAVCQKKGVQIPEEILGEVSPVKKRIPTPAAPKSKTSRSTKWPVGTEKNGRVFDGERWVTKK